MSFFQMNNMLTSLNSSSFDERQWVKLIRRTLDQELEEETDISVTIFGVPKALMVTDPDCYIPQQVAIGPYHHLRPELYDMERYKITAAKRNQKELQNSLKFQHLVEHVMKHELRIRASYHRPLGFECETLAWMMAVDTAFLYEVLQVCGVREGKRVLTRIPSTLAHLVDVSGNKTMHNAILRDIMMLENQIPLFVVRMLVEFHLSSLETSDELLHDMLIGVCKELSPFKTVEGPNKKIEIRDCAHFLDFLYQFMVPKIEVVLTTEINVEIYEDDEEAVDAKEKEEEEEHSFAKPSHVRRISKVVWNIVCKLEKKPVDLAKRIIFSKPVKVFAKLPWTIITKIPVVSVMKEPVEHIFGAFSQTKEKDDKDDDNNSLNKQPVLEEISIPSVTQLLDVGVRFVSTNEGIQSINFDTNTRTFHIPIINLDVNSEVVLRNLVAYEACGGSEGPLVLSRYTELMNGIIDTDEDARFLCQHGIIINHLKSEKEVADLWNGMSKSVRLTKVPCLDKVIRDVNKFYNGRWKVKFGKFMKKYVFNSWKILTFLAAVMLMVLMMLQSFCQVYSCGRLLHIEGLEPADI